jgi:CheY-like chemotaxis protein
MSQFYVPCEEQPAASSVRGLPPYSLSPGHLLFVDDDQVSLLLWGEIFEEAGYTITLSSGAESALGHDMQLFDLAILDFDMPGCDGRALLLRMRAAHAAFPIILYSGSADTLPWRLVFSSPGAFLNS